MNVLLVSITQMRDLNGSSIYQNLMRKFRDEGHNVYVISAYERKFRLKTSIKEVDGIHLIGVRTLNNVHTNIIEKGFSLLTLEYLYIRAIKKLMGDVMFDIILSSTPPIMLTNVIKYVKKRCPNALTYLLLKDIFPQNAVDLKMFSKRSPLYWYFRQKEKDLYKTFDYIGCMSPANVEYVIKHNRYVNPRKVEVAPNCADIKRTVKDYFDKNEIKKKYNLPLGVPIMIYGGSLGKPQGIPFLIQCLDANKDRSDCYFVIVGSGTEYGKIEKWINTNTPKSVSLFNFLPKVDYDRLVQSCDIGLIFLDHRFTIPNFPSRLLAYLENKTPIIAATDVASDIGRIAEDNGFGYWCESNDVHQFTNCIDKILESNIKKMGEIGYNFLCDNYLVDNTYKAIMNHV